MPNQLLDDHQIPTEFAVYQRFNRLEDMQAVENTGEWREAIITGSPLRPEFWIEIPASQFEKANFMLQEAAEERLSDADLDAHPFADYARLELEEVLLEETEWSPDAVVVARKLLLRQGYDVDLERLRARSRKRITEAFQPKSGTRWVLGLFTLYGGFTAMSASIVGIMVALGVLLYYVVGSQRDPKGKKHWVYDEPTRKIGRVALVIVALCLAFGLVNLFYLNWITFPSIDVWYWIWF